ncbi:DUF771 domain-containing protein [Latilactobacillus curvatus]|uniref:DUF771 domain-containing protein n=1 Tax=Latilactobacillus curvatus TaxID=28038 RepID=UPI0013A65469|nr:DUF771 domain-containing protein [Latilactobacillus curvatus]
MNQLTVTVPITLPDGYEIIETEKRERLEADKRIIWDINKAAEISGITKKDMYTILQQFKPQLDIDNGGCVYYPYGGSKYRIESLGFTKFMRNNFARIMKEVAR